MSEHATPVKRLLTWLRTPLFVRGSASPDRATLREPSGWLVDLLTSRGKVAAARAYTIGAVMNCVDLRSRVMGTLPLHVYQMQPNGQSRRADWMKTAQLFRSRPNPWMNPSTFWRVMWANYDLHGNAYAEIQWGEDGLPAFLWPIPAQLVEVKPTNEANRAANPSGIDYNIPTFKTTLKAENVLHLKGFSTDGLVGLSKITSAARTVGLADATETYGDNFFANGGMPSGTITLPKPLSPDAAKRLRESWTASYGTLTNSQRVAVLEDGAEFKPITVSPRDVQFLEVRKFSAGQIAALYGVPARLVGANDGPVGWGSVEQETLEWTQFGLTPDLVQAEQEIRYKLLGGSDTYYAKFNLDGLLRADIKTRMEAHAIAWQHGALTVDEWRGMEEMGPVDDGSRRFIPANFVPADRVDDLITARVQKGDPPGSPAQ